MADKQRLASAGKGNLLGLSAMVALGYGCYLSLFPLGPIGTMSMAAHVSGTLEVVAVRAVAFVCVGAAMLVQCGERLRILRGARFLYISYALLAFALCALWLAGGSGGVSLWAVVLWSVVYGASLGLIELQWYGLLAVIWDRGGAKACFCTVCLCMAVGCCSTLLFPLSRGGSRVIALTCVAVVSISAMCMAIARSCMRRGVASCVEQRESGRCRPTLRFSGERFANGVVWTIGATVLVQLGFYRGVLDGGVLVSCAIALLVAAVLGAFSASRDFFGRLAYGAALRWSVTLLGAVFTLVPLFAGRVPWLAAVLCFATYQAQNIFNVSNTVSFCRARHLSTFAAVPPYYAVYALSVAVASALACVAYAFLDGTSAASALSAVAVVSMLLLVPTLPMRASSVDVMAFERLPEDEDREQRISRAVDGMVDLLVLTKREEEVLRLVVSGYSREAIAEELGISASTVKNHITNLYAKAGVHSSRELAVLVESKGLGKQTA